MEDIKRKIERQNEASVSNGTTLKCTRILVALQQLRMLCNLGTMQAWVTAEPVAEPMTECSCGSEDEDSADPLVQSLAFCPECGQLLNRASSGDEFSDGNIAGEDSAQAPETLTTMDWSLLNTPEVSVISPPRAYHLTKLVAVVEIISAGLDGK